MPQFLIEMTPEDFGGLLFSSSTKAFYSAVRRVLPRTGALLLAHKAASPGGLYARLDIYSRDEREHVSFELPSTVQAWLRANAAAESALPDAFTRGSARAWQRLSNRRTLCPPFILDWPWPPVKLPEEPLIGRARRYVWRAAIEYAELRRAYLAALVAGRSDDRLQRKMVRAKAELGEIAIVANEARINAGEESPR